MAIRFCKNRKCEIVLNEYNTGCSCVYCDKAAKHCDAVNCSAKGAMHASEECYASQLRKCHGCMQFSRYIISQRNR